MLRRPSNLQTDGTIAYKFEDGDFRSIIEHVRKGCVANVIFLVQRKIVAERIRRFVACWAVVIHSRNHRASIGLIRTLISKLVGQQA